MSWFVAQGPKIAEPLLTIETEIRDEVTRAELEGRSPSWRKVDEWRRLLEEARRAACDTTAYGDLELPCKAISYADALLEELGWTLERYGWERDLEKEYGVRHELALVDEYLDEMEKYVKEYTGRSCRWGKHLGEARLRPTMLLNDLAACLHVIAQHVLEKWPERMEGRCLIARNASEEAVRVCREWNSMTEFLSAKGYYIFDDEAMLRGYAFDEKVQLRVGGVQGHLTEIDLKRGTLAYYDDDKAVNTLMKRLLEEYAGAECELKEGPGVGVSVPSLTCKLKDPVKAARAVAFATSMDVRLERRWKQLAASGVKSCIERALAELLEPRKPSNAGSLPSPVAGKPRAGALEGR